MIRPTSKETAARTALVVIGDFLLSWGALATAVHVRRSVPLFFVRDLLPPWKLVLDGGSVLLYAGSFVLALGLSGFYRRPVVLRERPMILVALAVQLAMITTGGVLIEMPVPRTILAGVLGLELIAFPAWRSFLRRALPVRPRETILVGQPTQVRRVINALAAVPDGRIDVVGWIGPHHPPKDDPLACPYLGPLEDPGVLRRLRETSEVVLVDPDVSPSQRLEMLTIRGARGYLLVASHADALLTSTRPGWVGDQPVFEVAIRCGYGYRAVIKRLVDTVLASLLIVVATPLAIVVAVSIRLNDSGPILIRQIRMGKGCIPFAMWKFRSMPVESRVDEGITRTGAFLRRYRLDEIPQLLNVIAGQMSLVGPRPERPEIIEQILREIPEFQLRCLVRPGLAGLAQVSGEYDSPPDVKLRYDLMYMCGWSLLLDLRLLLASVSASLSGSGR